MLWKLSLECLLTICINLVFQSSFWHSMNVGAFLSSSAFLSFFLQWFKDNHSF